MPCSAGYFDERRGADDRRGGGGYEPQYGSGGKGYGGPPQRYDDRRGPLPDRRFEERRYPQPYPPTRPPPPQQAPAVRPPPPPETDGEPSNQYIFDKLVEREKARVRRDFGTADSIREELSSLGVEIWESKGERTWKAKDGRIGPRPNHEGKCY